MFKFFSLVALVGVVSAVPVHPSHDQAPYVRPVKPFYDITAVNAKHQGTDVRLDANIPLVHGDNKLGPWSINGGAGVDHHIGGPYGDRMGDRRVFLGFEQRFGKH